MPEEGGVMLGLNYLAWLGIVSWIGVPLLAFFTTGLLWRHSQSDLSKVLALAAGIAILSMPLLISNAVKAYFDRQVRELCAKDGGVRVYETVGLPKERFDEFGNFRIPIKKAAKPVDEYFYEWNVHHFRDGNPSVERDHFLIFRRSDMTLLGEAVSYVRIGGDVPGPWIESSFRCPKESGNPNLLRLTFIQKKGE
jgi:hypothetical protein